MNPMRKAQSIMEYAAILAVVSTALLSMRLYFKQYTQAGIKGLADYVGSQKTGSVESDYEYTWFTDGIKGRKARSQIESGESGNTRTELLLNRGVINSMDSTIVQSGTATWAVGIERSRGSSGGGGGTSGIPVYDPPDPPEPPPPPPTVEKRACPPKDKIAENWFNYLLLRWFLFWRNVHNGADLRQFIQSTYPWLLADEYKWMQENNWQGLYDWIFNRDMNSCPY